MSIPVAHVILPTEFGVQSNTITNASIANTLSELAISTLTIPAGFAAQNDVWVFEANGSCDIVGTPTITFRLRVGGVGGAALATIPVSAVAASSRPWACSGRIRCVSPGSGATWHGYLKHTGRIAGGASPGISAIWEDNSVSAVSRSSIVNQDLVLTAQWSVAAAGNSLVPHDAGIEIRR